MKFTTPCFIRKNTPELCKKLEELGYKRNHYFDEESFNDEDVGLQCNPLDCDNNIITGEYTDLYCLDEEELKDCGIDCNTNEQLFLAIAALRDSSDIHQLFTDGHSWGGNLNLIVLKVELDL